MHTRLIEKKKGGKNKKNKTKNGKFKKKKDQLI